MQVPPGTLSFQAQPSPHRVVQKVENFCKQSPFTIFFDQTYGSFFQLFHPPLQRRHLIHNMFSTAPTSSLCINTQVRVESAHFRQLPILCISSILVHICTNKWKLNTNAMIVLPIQHCGHIDTV